MENISGVYKITNTVTNDFYIGSSKDVKHRWADYKCPSTWKKQPNSPMYLDMQKYGVDKFDFQILEEAETGQLKAKEQEFIEKLQPTYNNRRANELDVEKQNKFWKKYRQTNKYKETKRKSRKKYNSQLCSYNGEMLTLSALVSRFTKSGIEHPTAEAKKYLL